MRVCDKCRVRLAPGAKLVDVGGIAMESFSFFKDTLPPGAGSLLRSVEVCEKCAQDFRLASAAKYNELKAVMGSDFLKFVDGYFSSIISEVT